MNIFNIRSLVALSQIFDLLHDARADSSSLSIPRHSSCDITSEIDHLDRWSTSVSYCEWISQRLNLWVWIKLRAVRAPKHNDLELLYEIIWRAGHCYRCVDNAEKDKVLRSLLWASEAHDNCNIGFFAGRSDPLWFGIPVRSARDAMWSRWIRFVKMQMDKASNLYRAVLQQQNLLRRLIQKRNTRFFYNLSVTIKGLVFKLCRTTWK